MHLKRTLIAASVLSIVGGAASALDLTMVSWGGAYQKSQIEAYAKPYMKLHPDIHILWDESSAEAVAKLRAMNEANNLTWDLVDVDASDSFRLCDEGLAMEYKPDELLAPAPDGTPASKDFGQQIVNSCYIPEIVYSTTFGYRNDNPAWKGAKPTSICDIFDLKKFPGKRALEKRPINNVEWALLCDGVPKDKLYDVLGTDAGVDRALKKLDTIKDQTIWWSAAAETPQLLADNEVAIGSTYNGRLFSAIVEQHQPISMLWDAQVFSFDGWVIPTGLSPERLAAVKDFVRFATDTQRLADQAKYISYGPARKSSAPLVGNLEGTDIAMAPYMPTDPANSKNVIYYNFTFWADHRDDIDAKFQAWLAQ